MQPETAAQLAAAIETPRLWLEPLRESHAEAFFPALQDEAVYRWISMPKPASLAALRARWRSLEATRISPDGDCAWPAWAVRRKSDGLYLGRVDAEITDTFEASNLGFYFFSPFWGQGYATEAAAAAAAQLAARGVHRFVATVTVGNQASGRVLQKVGFKFTRILIGNDVIRGEAMDDEEYVLEAAQGGLVQLT
ncbi:GNAT family N-acetyltransferase [Paucibacter sp. AS339]|uniref:GNAT family N-acetyltransferase n=1 Tax=Paucibacter hankyongi TaxID=3133434 RepID=UPI0030A2785C